MAAKKKKVNKCEANTEFCSGELVRRYSVNNSDKEGETFLVCGACMVILQRRGTKFKAVA